ERHDYVNHRITSLPANDSFTFSEAGVSSLMEVGDVPSLLYSGQGLDVQATTFSSNDIKRTWNIRYRGIRLEDRSQLEWYMKTYYVNHIALEARKQSSFLDYLSTPVE